MIKLVISDNEGATTVVPLVRDEISIGRQAGNTIRLTERNVSRRHARLVRNHDSYVIEDLGSYNGVQINGQKCSAPAPVRPGDKILIGDYSLVVQSELAANPETRRRSLAPAPQTPARLVMLGSPAPGAEFSLPEEGSARMGRSEDLAIPINHRSVSREHAQVTRDGSRYVVSDLGSANGMFVNGRKVKEHALNSGDVIELGQVALRFVSPGEDYFFDPNEAARFAQGAATRSKENARLALVLLASAVAIAAIVFFSDRGMEPEESASAAPPPPAATAPTESPAPTAAAKPDYDKSLSACRVAIAGQRYTEAGAHASLALGERPGDADALACQAEAQRLFDDEQAFARGQAAMLHGDPEAATQEFARLSDDSPYQDRPEVQQAIDKAAETRLSQAGVLADQDREQATILAQSVVALPGVSDKQREAAVDLVEALKEKSHKKRSVSHRASKPRPRPDKPSAAPEPSGPSPMEEANACLMKGDNRCVVEALAGKARSEREIALLIETYRAMGNSQAALKYMQIYVKRFPSARRTQTYEEQLKRAGQ